MSLEKLRQRVDDIDRQIIALIAKRAEIADKIGAYKKKYRLAIGDMKREKEVIRRIRGYAKKQGLSPDLAEALMRKIIANARERQRCASA